MKRKLLISGISKYLCGILVMGLMLFWPAGTMEYPGGWRLMAALFIPMLVLGIVLFIKAPALLSKRLNSREKENTQKGVVLGSLLMFLGGFILSGLDFRFGWAKMPLWISVLATALLLASYGLYAEVMRENAYLSRTIEVQAGQKVIDTGLYGIVRHPMYSATILLFLSMPLVLGSWIGFIVFLVYPGLIVIRIGNEEKVLAESLPGYEAYMKKVKWRLLPFVW